MLLTDDEIISEKNNHFYEDRYGETFNFLEFARAIEDAILKKIGDPACWQIRNGVCHAGIRSNKEDAELAAENMQKCHDLG